MDLLISLGKLPIFDELKFEITTYKISKEIRRITNIWDGKKVFKIKSPEISSR